jgi:hypothetical protein
VGHGEDGSDCKNRVYEPRRFVWCRRLFEEVSRRRVEQHS